MRNVAIPMGTHIVRPGRPGLRLRFAILTVLLLGLGFGSSRANAADDPLDTARARVNDHRLPEAIAILQAEVRAHPDRDEARQLLARVLSWEQRYDESLAQYQALLERHPDDAATRAGYARVLSWSGQHDAAIREYRLAIAADSTNLETRVGYARVLSWSGDVPGAAIEFDRILELNPNLGDAWLGNASVARWRGAATASDRFLANAERFGGDAGGIQEERRAVRLATQPSLGAGWTSSHERQYVEGPDFILESEGPYTSARGTVSRTIGISARVAWLNLTETPASGDSTNYDLSSVDSRVDLSLLRDYPWQVSLGGEVQTFEQRDGPTRYPLLGDDSFFGWSARAWRFSGRFTPRVSARREYVALKDTLETGLRSFEPGHVDNYEGGLAYQWNARGTADALVSRGVYSDENRRWSAGGGLTYRAKTHVPTVTLDARALYRDWNFKSASYFTPLQSVRGAAAIAVGGYAEHPAADYGFRYEFAGIGSTNFADIWTHAWSGYANVTAFGVAPIGIEASYSIDNNSYEAWSLGLSGSVRW